MGEGRSGWRRRGRLGLEAVANTDFLLSELRIEYSLGYERECMCSVGLQRVS